MANFIAAMVYVYMQFFPVADFVIVIGHMSWQLGHGCPAIIYLFMNTTIRSGVSKIFRFKVGSSFVQVVSMGLLSQVYSFVEFQKPINTRTTTTVSVVGHGHQHHHHSSSLQ